MDPLTDIAIADFTIAGLLSYVGSLIFTAVPAIEESSYEIVLTSLLEDDGVEALTNIASDESVGLTGKAINAKDKLLQLYNSIDPQLPEGQFLEQVDTIANKLSKSGISIATEKGFNLLKTIVESANKYKTQIAAGVGITSVIASVPIIKETLKKIKRKTEDTIPIDEIEKFIPT